MKRRMKMTWAVSGVLVLTAAMLGACAQAPAAGGSVQATSVGAAAPEHSIRVYSRESVKMVPDMAEIQYSVVSQGVDAASCRDKNTADVNKVIAYLKEQAVEERSIQTSDINLNPQYNWNSGSNEIVGYEMSTVITVSDVSMEQLGSILNASVDAGVNNISGVSYTTADYDAAYQEALARALEAARVKAEGMAAAAGVELGDVICINELTSSTDANRYSNSKRMLGAAVAEAAASDMSIMPGTVDAEAGIEVVFALR